MSAANRRIYPAVVSGRVRAPPSKSYTHRALIAGFLTSRVHRVYRPLDADDTRATANGITQLGARISRKNPARWTLTPEPLRRPRRPRTIRCRESGTTLRFLCAVAALGERTLRFEGSPSLARRPMDELWEALRSLGAEVTPARRGRSLPFLVRGPLHAGSLKIFGGTSSQFVSALLLTLPVLDGDSEVQLTGSVVSRPYLDATISVLKSHGIRYRRRPRGYELPGSQIYRAREFRVPGDASSAAYLWTAAALTEGSIRVDGLDFDRPQADAAILPILEKAGADVTMDSDGATVSGGTLRPFTADLSDSPDLYPLLGTLAAFIPGKSRLLGAPHVVFKESNRREGTMRLASAFGARVTSSNGGLAILGHSHPSGISFEGLDDHRLVMSAAVGALAANSPSILGDARCVRKSFPEFWNALRSIGARTERAS